MARGGSRLAATGAAVFLIAACGGSSAVAPSTGESTAPTKTAPPLTTTLVPEAQVAGTPPPKPSTTTTIPPRPADFPAEFPLPPGQVGYYTGSPQLGFHLNISTALEFSELVRFFTDEIAAVPGWSISVRDVGQGFLPGFEGQWATYTAQDHVLTQVDGSYSGVIEIEGRHVNVLFDGVVQPVDGEELEALPPPAELPRPATTLTEARYSSGLVQLEYEGTVAHFIELLTAYRDLQWTELGVTDLAASEQLAVGELGKWRVTIRQAGSALELDFEDRSLSFP